MIIDIISDLHGFKPKLDGGDLLIVAGDLTATESDENWNAFEMWMLNQGTKYENRILVSGNHDNFLQSTDSFRMYRYWDKCVPSIEYLCDSGTEFEGLKIWGSPWTTKFPGMNSRCMAFTVDSDVKLAEKWELIPDDIDILITHSPPYGILDSVDKRFDEFEHVGSPSLNMFISCGKHNIKLHVFGHIHEHGGKKVIHKRPGIGTENNTIMVNASHVNEMYEPVNKPVRIIL